MGASSVCVVATDAPLLLHEVGRLCPRVTLGIEQPGSIAAHGSGEIVVGFSNADTVSRRARRRRYRLDILLDQHMDPRYRAVIEATEEVALNALCMTEPMEGLSGDRAPALRLDRVEALVARYEELRGA